MRGQLLERSDLSHADEEAMYALFGKYFQGVSRAQFGKDLDGKNWVILLRDSNDGALRGFSTLAWYSIPYRNDLLSAVYSGDTIVEPGAGAMGSALSRAWIGAVNYLRSRYANSGRLYWLLLVSGYRTYRFLPLYWLRFFPRHDMPTPRPVQNLMDFLAERRFGSLYHRAEGVVRFERPQVLCDELRGIPASRLADPHVAFFARSNPGHERGDELVCLTELGHDNLTPAGARMWAAGEQKSSVAAARG